MLARIAIPILFGVVAALVLAFVTGPGNESPGWVAPFLGGLLVFYFLVIFAPWIALRGGTWWLASAIGAIVGLLADQGAAFLVGGGMSICIAVWGSCPPPPQRPFGILFTIALGVLGIGQAFVVHGRGAKLVWALGSIFAGAALGFGAQLFNAALHLNDAYLNYLPAAIGGLAWGVAIGVTLTLVTRTKSTQAAA
jgi:hypothetical protein